MLEPTVLDVAWGGDTRYRPESVWNGNELRAYLRLYRRDTAAQTFRVTVSDPTNAVIERTRSTRETWQPVVRYPDEFANAPLLSSGTYAVKWNAVVNRDGQAVVEVVAEDTFQVP